MFDSKKVLILNCILELICYSKKLTYFEVALEGR